MNRNTYIAIEGPIGVGKTTLARILQQEIGGQLLLEEFEENPFLSDFYADRARYAFQTQIFFLLSRYRQQHEGIAHVLDHSPLVSDYLFAKDRLFAHLNLAGDELAVYERMHEALGERIPVPDLVVHLRAGTDVLMNRIATRDRPYERTMSRHYIEDLRLAYERFFADYGQAPVLVIDTSELDFVANAEDRRHVVGQLRSALQEGTYQQPLPQLTPIGMGQPLPHAQPHLGDLQRLYKQQEAQQSLVPEIYLNYISLTEHAGAVGSQLKRLWIAGFQGQSSPHLLDKLRGELRSQLADLLADLLRIANNASVDLEQATMESIGQQ